MPMRVAVAVSGRGSNLGALLRALPPGAAAEVALVLSNRVDAGGLQVARARGVPPYVIFHDQTLRELARHKPRTIDELHGIPGIGDRKAQAFGPALLEAIARHG